MSLTVADIMTTNIVSLEPENSLQDAHNITRDKGIRHLPVLDPQTEKFVALVTQKKMIAKVIGLLSLYGEKALSRREAQVNIMDIAETDCQTINKNEPLEDVARFFLENKHGCLPVVDDNGRLEGVITSSDFVRLSIMLMEQSAK